MNSSIKHTIGLLGMAITIVVITPMLLFAFMHTKDTNSNANASVNTNTSGGTSNTNTAAVESQPFYYAEKIGTTTTVYSQTALVNGTRTELFHFTERHAYEPGSYNAYDGMRPSVAYDTVNQRFAYTSVDGVFLYNPATKTTTSLITKTGELDRVIDGEHIPVWSNTDIPGVFLFASPLFSADGQYLSFVGGYYEGSDDFVMDMASKKIIAFSDGEGANIGTRTRDWSDSGHKLTAAMPLGMGPEGLFVAANENFATAINLLTLDIPDVEPLTAIYVGTDQIAYSYTTNTTTTEGYRTASAIHLGLINAEGSGQVDLVADGADNTPVAASGDQIIYSKSDVGDPTQNGLWLYNLSTGSNTLLVQQKESHVLSAQQFIPGSLSYIDINTTNNSATLYVLNPDTLDVVYMSLQTAEDTGLYYMGTAD